MSLRNSILISEQGEYQVRLVECSKPFPIILKGNKPVSPLFNNDIPLDIAERFWILMEEYNIFLEAEMEVEDDGYENSC